MTRHASLDTLLNSLRNCHEPTAADALRVRSALDATLGEARSPAECEEASGVHPKPLGGPSLERTRSGRAVSFARSAGRSRLLLGAVAVAAIAAVAVVTLAHPASFEPRRLVAMIGGDQPADDLSRTAEKLEGSNAAHLTLIAEPPEEDGAPVAVTMQEEVCSNWPCLNSQPALGFSLGGAEITRSERVDPEQAPGPESFDETASAAAAPVVTERDGGSGLEGRRDHRLQIAPVLAFDIRRGGVTPGAGVRVAVPVNEGRDLTLEATLQRFEADAAHWRSLWAVGAAGCWSPIAGKVDVGLCGDLGYERTLSAAGEEWRLTAGASAHAAWNVTKAAGLYLAMHAAVPVVGDGVAEPAAVMRVVAGPQLNF